MTHLFWSCMLMCLSSLQGIEVIVGKRINILCFDLFCLIHCTGFLNLQHGNTVLDEFVLFDHFCSAQRLKLLCSLEGKVDVAIYVTLGLETRRLSLPRY